MLIDFAPKDVHDLVLTDIVPEDKQNFGSFEKITGTKVINALKKYVIDSDATIVYLEICKNVTSSFLNPNLKPIERVRMIWSAIFLLRIWRDFIKNSNVYNIEDNFISVNAYTCIELNGLALIKLIVIMKDTPDLFLPSLFDSQVCEQTYRRLRAMGTFEYTKINFCLMELLHMISKVDIQNDIAYYRLANIAEFPRININVAPGNVHTMPCNEEIAAAIDQALKDSVETAAKFGMCCDENVIQTCQLKSYNQSNVPQKELRDENALIADQSDEEPDNIFYINRTENINVKESNIENFDENSKYIRIFNPDGSAKIVLKSAIVSLLADRTEKLSSDRLKRVRETPLQKTAKRQKTQKPECLSNLSNLKICSKIFIGDWCIFKYDPELFPTIKLPDNTLKNILVGSVLGFKFINGKTEKDKQYHLDSSTVIDDKTKKNRNDLNVLSSWYAISELDETRDTLIPLGYNLHLNINNYKCTAPIPTITEGNIFTIKNLCNLINSL